MSASPSKKEKKSRRPRNPEHERKEGLFNVTVRNLALSLTYRRLTLAALLSVVAMGVCLLTLFLIVGKPVPPQYIPVSEDGRLLPLVPLNQPNLDDGAIGLFALKTVKELNSYDYISWREQVLTAQPRFMPGSWGDYYKAFEQSNVINTVVDQKMIVVGRPTGNVEIENKGVGENGAFTWRVAVPLEIQFVSHANPNTSAGKTVPTLAARRRATIYIQRVPPTLSPSGIAVRAYQEQEVSGSGN